MLIIALIVFTFDHVTALHRATFSIFYFRLRLSDHTTRSELSHPHHEVSHAGHKVRDIVALAVSGCLMGGIRHLK